MFDQLKQLAKLKNIQDSLAKEKKEVVMEGVRVVVNGRMEIEEIILNPDLDSARQAEALKKCINSAFLQVQRDLAGKMFSSGIGI
ncbi:MAG: hypothetical protein A3H01_00835 [Candidatus Wildermuthbacteria bacterium RIFCSPLOWO2_12_FULL_40_9]|uniref:Nucleoid-associated protein, YbaB/EbfC family n=2 Tax=Candidatus Wildermuthiibacteriota TaxID=1817923 RepID=A0A1G2RDI4_9BACT|nr:MAG: hypothetical protein A3F15_02055 [Candidatus Wildermuthbacteria bacterium RIFCSPHIGHO2_12_FULL_40_12]OHA76807.1 MAG: hypothetical protein A3H01_00835 [Candidatus Wildermuthbacteria bacterium RIFCSPLOWO2_12_FULL_40_9]